MKTTTPLSRSQRLLKIEKVLTLFIYYGLPIIVVLTLSYALYSSQNTAFRSQARRAEQGINLLIITLFIKPISILGKKYAQARIISAPQAFEILKDIVHSNKHKPQRFLIIKDFFGLFIDSIYSLSCYLMPFRRQLGLTTFRFIATHLGLLQIYRYRQDLPLTASFEEKGFITGFLGFIALFIGAITSNNHMMKVLKTKRKTVQSYAAYIAFGFAAFHTGNIFALIVYIILKYYEAKETKHQAYLFIQKYKNKFIG